MRLDVPIPTVFFLNASTLNCGGITFRLAEKEKGAATFADC